MKRESDVVFTRYESMFLEQISVYQVKDKRIRKLLANKFSSSA